MEIYRESGSTVQIEIPLAAEPAPSSVSAQVTRDGSSSQPTIITTSVVAHDGYKLAPVEVPYGYTLTEGDLTVNVTFTINNANITKSVPYKVITPILHRSDVPDVSSADYNDLEPIVRHYLEVYCHQYFGNYEGTETVRGKSFDYLRLPVRLISLSGISFSEEDYEPDSFFTSDDGWQLHRANWETLTIKQAPPDPSTVNPSGVITAPYSRLNTTFWQDRPYTLDGVWGYDNVPTPVREAAKLLMADWSCQDASYRNKYLENFRAADWRIQFKSQAYAGTGNLTADMLLNDYVRTRMEIV